MSSLPSLLEIIKKSTAFLSGKGVETARLDTELLIGHALGLKRMQLYIQFERPLAEAELEKIRPLIRRRGNREPLQYILGTTEFAGLTLKVDRRALIPRPETEYLVEILVQRLLPAPGAVLDLGTGSGAIALALAKTWPEARVMAAEKNPETLALARENATFCGLDGRVVFMESHWYAQLPSGEAFDLIVANPPYLSDGETDQTAAEVREYEPRGALSAGPKGTEDQETIIRGAQSRLRPGGWLALETGIEQHAQLSALTRECGCARSESIKDLTGRDRYFLAAF